MGRVVLVEGVFTESHLVGYACCVAGQDLPAEGTLARTMSDLFRAPLGQHLLDLVFVGTSAAIAAYRARRQRDALAVVCLVLGANLLYLALSLLLAGVGWGVSAWAYGPQQTPYAGLERRAPGIVLHAVLWAAYFWTILRLPAAPKAAPPARPISAPLTGHR